MLFLWVIDFCGHYAPFVLAGIDFGNCWQKRHYLQVHFYKQQQKSTTLLSVNNY